MEKADNTGGSDDLSCGKRIALGTNQDFSISHEFTESACGLPSRLHYRDDSDGQWSHVGVELQGECTGTFKWMEVEFAPNLTKVWKSLQQYGTKPSGQWVEVLAIHFKPDGWRAIPDPSWIAPDGKKYFPKIGPNGLITLELANVTQYDNVLWLVQVK